MKVFNLVKSSIFGYPTLFSTRLDVFIHLFSCIGNGYEWIGGELKSVCGPDKIVRKMKYEDLDEKISEYKKELKEKGKNWCLKELTESWLVNLEFEKIKRQFIEKNIKVAARDIEVLLEQNYEVYMGYYMENPCYDYARIFHIPKDIKPDWGDAAQEFAKFWRGRLYAKNQGFVWIDTSKKPYKEIWIKKLKDIPVGAGQEYKNDWK